MEIESLSQLATLSHPSRMAVYRLLMRRYPDAVSAGEIARALGFKASTASVYLSALKDCGLIGQERAGTARLYRVRMPAVQGLMQYLWADCCRGRPDLCPVPSPEAASPQGHRYSVLFLCTANSARSIMAEALLRQIAGDRFLALSAGTQPRTEPHPQAIALLRDEGHDLTPLRTKNLSAFQGAGAPPLDFVITVCDRAANEECPSWEGQPFSTHWGVPDPVCVGATEAEQRLAFRQAHDLLQDRILRFADLPLGALNKSLVQHAIDDIADMTLEPQ